MVVIIIMAIVRINMMIGEDGGGEDDDGSDDGGGDGYGDDGYGCGDDDGHT